MTNLYNQFELHLSNKTSALYIHHIQNRMGVNIRIRKQEADVYSSVYGPESGQLSEDYVEARALVVYNISDTEDKSNAGPFDEGWMWTTFNAEVNVGDVIEVQRDDKKFYKYKVASVQSLGLTQSVVIKYRLAAYHE